MSLEETRLLLSVVIYIAGIPLFWGRAVHYLSTDENMLDAARRAPEAVSHAIIRVMASVMSLLWFPLMTWEFAEIIWDLRPWGGDD